MIHPTAVIEKGAELGQGARIGPYAFIGAHVCLGDGCEVRQGAVITGHTTVGRNCMFFSHCVIGDIPQDLKYRGEPTHTLIGDDNHFREFVTVHAGTEVGGGVTRIGNHNRLLVGVHVAHDAHVGNHVVISNNTQVAGHVHIEDCVTIGGLVAIHHFVSIGQYAMLGGFSRVPADMPPYMISVGYPAEVRGPNTKGLQRWGLSPEDIRSMAQAYRTLYAKRAAQNGAFAERLQRLQEANGQNAHVQYLCEFLKRTLSVGNVGRYRESLRRDTVADNRAFFSTRERGLH